MAVDADGGYTRYSQLDDAWQRIMLGQSSTTIGKNGCLMCSVASGLADRGVTIDNLPPDPPRLNRWLTRNDGYTAARGSSERNLFVFDGLKALGVRLVEYIDARSSRAPFEKLEKPLRSEDKIVVLHVDFTPGGSNQQHWVRAVAWHAADVKIMDPWIVGSTQEAYLMTRYALPSWDDMARAIFRIAIYEVGGTTQYPASALPKPSIVQDELYAHPDWKD